MMYISTKYSIRLYGMSHTSYALRLLIKNVCGHHCFRSPETHMLLGFVVKFDATETFTFLKFQIIAKN